MLRRVPLPPRTTGVLEAESGFNDAPVVILVVAFSAAGPVEHWYVLVAEIAWSWPSAPRSASRSAGWAPSAARHVALPASGLYPIAVMAIAVSAYAAGAMAHGSGFLAVYLAAMILGNSKLPHWPATRGFADGLGWLAQIGMFVLLGLLVTPHDLVDDFWPAVVVGLVLTMVARPLSVLPQSRAVPAAGPREGPHVLGGAARGGAHHPGDYPDGVPGGGQYAHLQHRLRPGHRLHPDPGATLPWVASKLNIAEDPAEADDLGIESAPLERLRGHLLSVAVPAKSKMHRVEVSELRLPAGAAVTLVVRENEELRTVPGDGPAARGRTAGGGHRSGARPGGGTSAGGRRGRQAGRLAGHRRASASGSPGTVARTAGPPSRRR
ncbi:potassium/proton antiporter [Streptomyces californicus]